MKKLYANPAVKFVAALVLIFFRRSLDTLLMPDWVFDTFTSETNEEKKEQYFLLQDGEIIAFVTLQKGKVFILLNQGH